MTTSENGKESITRKSLGGNAYAFSKNIDHVTREITISDAWLAALFDLSHDFTSQYVKWSTSAAACSRPVAE